MIRTDWCYLSFLLFLFFVFCSGLTVGQNCTCHDQKNLLEELELLVEQKDFNKFESTLAKIKSGDVSCIQRKWGLLIEKYLLQGEFEKADSTCKIFHKSITKKTCKPILALYIFERGSYFLRNNLYDSAIVFLVKAQEMSVLLKDTSLQLKTVAKFAILFQKMEQPEKAIEYDRIGINLSLSQKNDQRLVQFYSNMIGHFGMWYDINSEQVYLDSMTKYLPISIGLAKKLNNKSRISQNYSIMAGISYLEKKYNKALTYCDSSLSYLDKTKDFRLFCPVYQKKCDSYIELGNYKLALQFADSSLIYAKKDSEIFMEAVGYERLYECHKLLGNTVEALKYYEKAAEIRDSLRTQEITQTVNDLEQKYQKVENEKKISELNKENEIASLNVKFLAVGILAAIMIIVVIVFFYRQSVLKSKFQALETEQRLNRARINPHFFFNVLASIQSLSVDKENSGIVSKLISQFSRVMRQSLESTYDELTSIETEIEFLENYLDIQRNRFLEKFDYVIRVDENIEIHEVNIPGMLLQPFIENSIEHGFANIDHKGKIEISFRKLNEYLIVLLKDNGRGFEPGSGKAKTYPSRAIQIINDRLMLLNKKYNSNARFELKENSNQGVSVVVYLPIIYK